jgi:hypothetical protein
MIISKLCPKFLCLSLNSQTFLASVLATRIYYAYNFQHSYDKPEQLGWSYVLPVMYNDTVAASLPPS